MALVTGGDSGIGRAVSVLLAKEAAKAVAIVYLPKEQPVRGWGVGGWEGRAGCTQGLPGATDYLPKEQPVGAWALNL